MELIARRIVMELEGEEGAEHLKNTATAPQKEDAR